MKRRTYIVSIVDTDTMQELATTTANAWNSGIKACEQLVRDYARSKETTFTAPHNPTVVGGMESPDRQYMRTWKSPQGQTIVASVWESK